MQAHIPGTAGVRPARCVDRAVFDYLQAGVAEQSSDFGHMVVFDLTVGPGKTVYFV